VTHAVTGVIVAAALAAVAPAAVAAEPGATAVVTTCGQVVTEDAALAADLHCLSGGGIVVDADDVVVDLVGHTLSGTTTGNGVSADGRDGIVVRNGTVAGFAIGVALQGGTGARIEALRVEVADNEEASGILLDGTDDSGVRDNVVVGGGFGVSLLFSADGNTVVENVTEDVEQGVFVVSSSGNQVVGNEMVRNAAGVVLGQAANRNVVEGNLLLDGLTGIYVDPDANLDNVLRRNVATDHDSAGIFIDEGTSSTLVIENVADRNDVGIAVRAPLTTLTPPDVVVPVRVTPHFTG